MRQDFSRGSPPLLLLRVGANLSEARERAGLTQAKLAERCGLHTSEISLIERAGREPRLAVLIKLADSLGVPPGDLCAGARWSVERQRYE